MNLERGQNIGAGAQAATRLLVWSWCWGTLGCLSFCWGARGSCRSFGGQSAALQCSGVGSEACPRIPPGPWDDGGPGGSISHPPHAGPVLPIMLSRHFGSSKKPQKRPKEGQQVPGSRQGVRAAHLGHDAGLVHEEPAEARGFLGDGVGVEARQAVPQRQVLGLVVFGCCLGWEDTKEGEKRSEEETSWLSRQRR